MTIEEIEAIGLESLEDLLFGTENCKSEAPTKDKLFIGQYHSIHQFSNIVHSFSNSDNNKEFMNNVGWEECKKYPNLKQMMKRNKLGDEYSYESIKNPDLNKRIHDERYIERIKKNNKDYTYSIVFQKEYSKYILEFDVVVEIMDNNGNYEYKKCGNFLIKYKNGKKINRRYKEIFKR